MKPEAVPMIWFVITEPLRKARSNPRFRPTKYLLEDCSYDICLELNYSQVSERTLREARPWAIVHSGGGTPAAEHDILQCAGYVDCVRNWPIPQLGICKGMQTLCRLHGSTVDRMRPLREGEADPNPNYYAGFFKETDFMPVDVRKSDRLFSGLPESPLFDQNHAEEVKALPEGFELLASSKECGIQSVRRLSGAPLYGVQFHPERADEGHPDGFRLIRNFFELAREFNA